MIYRVKCEISRKDIDLILPFAKNITPIYRYEPNESDVTWIHENVKAETACEHVWEMYCDTFEGDMILSKYKFYELIRQELNMVTKNMRLTDNSVRYCFISKST